MTEPNEPKEQEFGELVEIQLAPCVIHTERSFLQVDDVGAWYYTPAGVVATGKWNLITGFGDETTVFIPFQQIRFIEYDYDALARWQEHQESA